ncbi:MAG: damage-inducible protein DinB, partial [Candidatus Dormibacteraeota bacterium]|nr:damage-inducible protein DinB [Candidatus Dormibacteraeota bacterium]
RGEGGTEFAAMADWDEDEALATRSAAELVRGLQESWALIKSALLRWSPSDYVLEFQRPTPNAAGERPSYPRQWIVWHLVEHDLHHGGEISFSLGMHGVAGLDL